MNFIKSLDILDAWSWKKSYVNAKLVENIQWEIEIVCSNGECIKSSGSNKFPDSNDTKPSGSFLSFITSIENLLESPGLISLV